jgi:5,10-methylene-tetrahydrofolate dehydrogenase/methenyl tetrahydrofolate cyclohydrolase
VGRGSGCTVFGVGVASSLVYQSSPPSLTLSFSLSLSPCISRGAAHSRTTDLAGVVKEADIVIAAAGQPGMIKGDWLKPGAVVIDVGTNPVDDATKKAGFRLVGDCDWASCQTVAGAITPVPGGVGPMTIAMLLENTLRGAKRTLEGST